MRQGCVEGEFLWDYESLFSHPHPKTLLLRESTIPLDVITNRQCLSQCGKWGWVVCYSLVMRFYLFLVAGSWLILLICS